MSSRCKNCGIALKASSCVFGKFCNGVCQESYYEWVRNTRPVKDVFRKKIIVGHTVLYFSDGKADNGNFAKVVEVHKEPGEPYVILEYMGKCTGPDFLVEYVQRKNGQRSKKITASTTKIIIIDELVKMVQLDPTVGHSDDPIEDRNEILDL